LKRKARGNGEASAHAEKKRFVEVGPGQSACIRVPDARVSRAVQFIEVASGGRKVLCALNAK
jgi:hypothetical protein